MNSANPNDPGTINRYAYVGGDPVDRHDPRGLASTCTDASNDCGCDDDPYSAECATPGGGGGTDTSCFSACSPDPDPGGDAPGAAPSPPPTPACNTDEAKITTTLYNLGSDILGITAQKDAAITPADLIALQVTFGLDVKGELGDPTAFFDGGHFNLDLSLSAVANDFGGSATLAYTDFVTIFDFGGNGRRYPNPLPTTDPGHSYYLHDHSSDNDQILGFHFDRYNPYRTFPLGAILHGAVDVLYGQLGTHCLDPAWRH